MNITRFAVHVISNGVLVAAVSGQTHVVGQFALQIGELVSGFEGSTMGPSPVGHVINSHMKNAVDQGDTRCTRAGWPQYRSGWSVAKHRIDTSHTDVVSRVRAHRTLRENTVARRHVLGRWNGGTVERYIVRTAVDSLSVPGGRGLRFSRVKREPFHEPFHQC